MVALLGDDELNTKNEEYVFELIVKWVSKDEDNRISHIADLMNTVRSGYFPVRLVPAVQTVLAIAR